MKRLALVLAFLAFAIPSWGQAIRVPSRGANGVTPESICVPPCADGEYLVWDAGSNCFDCVSNLWVQGANGIVPVPLDGVIIGADTAFYSLVDGGQGDLKVNDDCQVAGGDLWLTGRANSAGGVLAFIAAPTSDGSDTGGIAIGGGGQSDPGSGYYTNTGRGAILMLRGNENASVPGSVILASGENTPAPGSNSIQLESRSSTDCRILLKANEENGLSLQSSQIVLDASDGATYNYLFDQSGGPGTVYFGQNVDTIVAEGTAADDYEFNLNFPNVSTNDKSVTLPSGAPSAGYFVKTDGSGVWSYADVTATVSSDSSANCRTGLDAGGLLCKNGFGYTTGLGEVGSANLVSNPLSAVDEDALDGIRYNSSYYAWIVGCESDNDGVASSASCVLGLNAAEVNLAGNANGGPTLLLFGADTAGSEDIAAGRANSIELQTGKYSGDPMVRGGTDGGRILLKQDHKYGTIEIAGPSEDYAANESAGLVIDRGINSYTGTGVVSALGSAPNTTFSTNAADLTEYPGLFAFINSASESTWSNGGGDRDNFPIYLLNTTLDEPSIIVEGQNDSDEYYLHFNDIGSGDKKITFPDASGTVMLEGNRRTHTTFVDAGSGSLDAESINMGAADTNANFNITANGDDASGAWLYADSDGTDEARWHITSAYATWADWLPDLTTVIKTGADTSNVTYWAGLSSDTDLFTVDDPTADLAAFRYNGTNGWYGCTNDNTGSVTCSQFTNSVPADTVYRLRIKFASTSSVEFWINGVLAGVRTTDLPTSGVEMTPYAAIRCQTAVVRDFKFGRTTISMN